MIFSPFSKRGNSQSVTYTNSSILLAISRGVLVGASAAGLLSVLSGLIDLTDSGDDTAIFLIFGTLITIICAYLTRYVSTKKLTRSETFLFITTGFLSCILFSSFLYLLLIEKENFGNAFFESAAAFTTTSLTVIDFEISGKGLIFYRTSSQLLGSFAALFSAVMVIPFSQDNFGAETTERFATQDVFPEKKKAVKVIFLIYLVSTLLLTLALVISELNFFDSLLIAISTISTGGFVINTDVFENSSVQLLLIAGMITTGTSIIVIWRLATRRITATLLSSEIKIYILAIVGAAFLLFLWADEDSVSSLGKAFLIAVSSISTTGFHIPPFENWTVSAGFLLLLLVTVGPMSLSNGGGFQIRRLQILLAVSVREMVRQLHPRAVVKIKVGNESVKEERVREVVVFQFIFTSIIFLTATVLTISGVSVYESLSSSINALATAGPIRNADGVIVEVSSFSLIERLALVPAMISGRLYLLPVLISVGYLFSESKNFLRPRRRILHAVRRSN